MGKDTSTFWQMLERKVTSMAAATLETAIAAGTAEALDRVFANVEELVAIPQKFCFC